MGVRSTAENSLIAPGPETHLSTSVVGKVVWWREFSLWIPILVGDPKEES